MDNFAPRMSRSDALMWDIERDPMLRSTIVAIGLFDEPVAWDQLVERVAGAAKAIPRMRQRAVGSPLRPQTPAWVDDPGFDLSYHLRRMGAAGEGDLRAVLDAAAPYFMAGFDRARPLWEFTLVEGMQGGGSALIQKIHHAVTDGVGGIQLAGYLFDLTPDATPPPPPEQAPAPAPNPIEVLARRAYGAVAFGTKAAFHPFGTAKAAVNLGQSLYKILAPVRSSLSPVMSARSLSWRFDAFDVRLADLSAAAHAAGGSLNDAFVAALAGGLARYHHAHGTSVDELRMTMPVNFRSSGDPMGGNRFTPVRFKVPVAITDPSERIGRLRDIMRSWRAEPALQYTDTIAGVLDRLPPAVTTRVFGGLLKAIDFVSTNVPGFPFPVYLAGAEMKREYAMPPPTGAAVNIALLSHAGTACIGITSDTAAVRDPDVFVECLRDGFDEVLAIVPAAKPASAA